MRRPRHAAGRAVRVPVATVGSLGSMGSIDVRVSFASLALVTLTSLAACKRKVVEEQVSAVRPVTSASSLPVDALAPGELAEGTEKVFGLMLPRAFRVVRQFDGVAYCRGQGRSDQVSNYVRRRVDARTVELGPATTVFPNVQVNGVDGGPKLRIEVADVDAETELIIRDVTPPPVVPGLTDEERLRRVGMKPGGGLIDRDHAF